MRLTRRILGFAVLRICRFRSAAHMGSPKYYLSNNVPRGEGKISPRGVFDRIPMGLLFRAFVFMKCAIRCSYGRNDT